MDSADENGHEVDIETSQFEDEVEDELDAELDGVLDPQPPSLDCLSEWTPQLI